MSEPHGRAVLDPRFGLATTVRQQSGVRVAKVEGALLAGIAEVLDEHPELTNEEVVCALVHQAHRWAERVRLDGEETDA